MSYNSITVDISATTIASEMSKNEDFCYAVLSELAYYVEVDHNDKEREKYYEKLFGLIFEDENEEVLRMFKNIVKSFEHLKEKNE